MDYDLLFLDLREKPEGDNDRPEGVFSVSSEPVIKKRVKKS